MKTDKQQLLIKQAVNLVLTLLFIVIFFPKVTHAATLYLSPSGGNYGVGSTITVSVRTDTQGVGVNTAEANIAYSTDTLELVRVSQGSTFYLSAPGSPSIGNGTAYFGGGLPTPGYTGGSGLIGSLIFRAKALGTATVSVTTGKVLLNDGFGTNALDGTSGARFAITPPPVGTPEVTSTTHPDSNGWYPNKNLELEWTRPAGAYGFSFELDKDPDTVPDGTLDTTVTTKKAYPDLMDGIWYFHIKARGQTTGFGNTIHFRIGVDNVAPKQFEIRTEGNVPDRFLIFATEDEPSGINRYDLYVDDKLFAENATSPFKLSELGGGLHKVNIEALDKAGNKTEAFINITVASTSTNWLAPFKNTVEAPLYLIFLFNFFLFIIIIILIFFLFRKREESKRVSFDLSDIKEEIDSSLEQLEKQISRKIENMKAKNEEELKEKELALDDEIREGIASTIEKIDGRIKRAKKVKK